MKDSFNRAKKECANYQAWYCTCHCGNDFFFDYIDDKLYFSLKDDRCRSWFVLDFCYFSSRVELMHYLYAFRKGFLEGLMQKFLES